MSDDLDDQIRRALKTLDSQVPSGYFEDLPSRTLGRLEQDMQTTREGTEASAASTSQPGMPAQREEDSGLHDIRSLASSQRMRIKRTSQNPILADEDVLASSSAGWKAVALPEPAKVVSLPELRESQKKLELSAPRPVEQKQAPATDRTQPVRTKKSGSKSVIAVVGLGLAAAAGVTLFVMNNQDASEHATSAPAAVASGRAEQVAQAPAPAAAAPTPAPAPAPTTTPTVESVPAIATDTAPQTAAAPAPPAAVAEAKADTSDRAKVAVMGKKTKSKPEEKPVATVSKAEPKVGKKAPDPVPAGGAAKGSGGEPATGGLDDLLKEAGVQQKQSPTDKPKPDKKSLDGSDIRSAMSAVQGKAQACYAGQQGTANVKLSVLPNGKVQKVTVTGVFAGTPVAACVAAAVKNATFPPWDGGPQSVSYSYLLSE